MEKKCEYENKCSLISNAFCRTEERFICFAYRDIEEKQMRYDDDL